MKNEAELEISFPKALLVSAIAVACLLAAILVMGVPTSDPILVGFLVSIGFAMPFVFAAFLCFMLRCGIGPEGLRPAIPTLRHRVLRWEDIATVRGFGGPVYFVRGRSFGGQCVLPRPFLLKRPEALRELVKQYAPEDNIVRKTLAV